MHVIDKAWVFIITIFTLGILTLFAEYGADKETLTIKNSLTFINLTQFKRNLGLWKTYIGFDLSMMETPLSSLEIAVGNIHANLETLDTEIHDDLINIGAAFNISSLADTILLLKRMVTDSISSADIIKNKVMKLRNTKTLIETYLHTENNQNDSHSIYDNNSSYTRKKRSLIHAGSFFKGLFNIADNDDFEEMNRKFDMLRMRQDLLANSYYLGESVLNQSSRQIHDNTKKLNELTTRLNVVSADINVLVVRDETMRKESYFMLAYIHYETILSTLNHVFIELKVELYNQINQLSTLIAGRLPIGFLPPKDFNRLLISIQSSLKTKDLTLAINPRNLIAMYSHTEISIIDTSKGIFIILHLSVVSGEIFDLFEVKSLPIPNYQIGTTNNFSLIAKYDISTEYFAMNENRQNYMIYSHYDFVKCTIRNLKFCYIPKPKFYLEETTPCEILSFLTDNPHQMGCAISLQSTQLPVNVEHIHGSIWLILTSVSIRIHIICANSYVNSLYIIEPPIRMIDVPTFCSIKSKWFEIPNTDLGVSTWKSSPHELTISLPPIFLLFGDRWSRLNRSRISTK